MLFLPPLPPRLRYTQLVIVAIIHSLLLPFLLSSAHFVSFVAAPSGQVLSQESVHQVSFYSPYSRRLKHERYTLKKMTQ